jgi:hypothetical protein
MQDAAKPCPNVLIRANLRAVVGDGKPLGSAKGVYVADDVANPVALCSSGKAGRALTGASYRGAAGLASTN